MSRRENWGGVRRGRNSQPSGALKFKTALKGASINRIKKCERRDKTKFITFAGPEHLEYSLCHERLCYSSCFFVIKSSEWERAQVFDPADGAKWLIYLWTEWKKTCPKKVASFAGSNPWSLHKYTRVRTLIVATIYLQLIQNRYIFRSFTVLHCSHQHCVQPIASDVEVVGYL